MEKQLQLFFQFSLLLGVHLFHLMSGFLGRNQKWNTFVPFEEYLDACVCTVGAKET